MGYLVTMLSPRVLGRRPRLESLPATIIHAREGFRHKIWRPPNDSNPDRRDPQANP